MIKNCSFHVCLSEKYMYDWLIDWLVDITKEPEEDPKKKGPLKRKLWDEYFAWELWSCKSCYHATVTWQLELNIFFKINATM